jgi:hypothetical protein
LPFAIAVLYLDGIQQIADDMTEADKNGNLAQVAQLCKKLSGKASAFCKTEPQRAALPDPESGDEGWGKGEKFKNATEKAEAWQNLR